MISIKNILRKLSLITLGSVLLVSCTQKRGEFIFDDLQSDLTPWGSINGIEGFGKVVAAGDYVYAIGTVGGFGVFHVPSQSLVPWYRLNGATATGPNSNDFFRLIQNGFESVYSMAVVERQGQRLVYASSETGLYEFNVGSPVKSLRLVGSGVGYVFKSMVYIPERDELIGFNERYMYTRSLASGITGATNAPQTLSFDIGCGNGAAYYQGKIYLAACNQLAIITPGSTNVALVSSYAAVDIATAGGFLFIQSQALSGLRAGVYIFNSSGANVKYMPLIPISFAAYVNGSQQYLFANRDDEAIDIFHIR